MAEAEGRRSYFVGIAGNIGVGKTTLTKIIAEKYNWKPYYEKVIDNPYLDDFYNDMRRWSFNLQVYFLSHRFMTHKEMTESGESCVQDRTIYEDVEIFARNLFELGNISKRDFDNYSSLFHAMTSYLKKPDLIVYLRASTDILLSRIQMRARGFEHGIDPEYLHMLNISYERWIGRIRDTQKVLVVETDNFNILKDVSELDKVLDAIRLYCPD